MRKPLLCCLFVAVVSNAAAQNGTAPPETLEPVKTSITVVDSVTAEAPGAVTVLDSPQIREIPGINLDDRLRSIPGFSLFRRNSSLVAHPTTQGISLRGIGSTGASRTLVLWDGIPVNDPFGGWVYWTRFQPDELERVEISRGASTSVFGDRAMGGAIGLFSRPPARRRWFGSYEAGNRNTHEVSVGASNVFGPGGVWGVSGHGRAFTTDGFFIVPEPYRGDIDLKAGVRFVAADARVDYLGPVHRIYLKSDILAEDRKNGTVLQNNSTSLGTVAMRYQGQFDRQTLSLTGFHTREEFRSIFSAIAADRNSERLTFSQQVPAEATGGSANWGLQRDRFNLLAGADVFRVEGYSIDSPVGVAKRIGGGTLLQHGVYTQMDATAGPARFFLGARENVTGQDRSFFSPSAGAVVGRGRFRARGSVYRSFRAPTLNELYREFRAGNAITRANDQLKPERLFGSEVGFDYVGETTRGRLTFYRNELTDLITNVTLSVAPNQIIRQRQNAVSAMSRGFELETAKRWHQFRGEASYLFVDARFAEGARVPQIPRHQGSAELTFEQGRTLVSAGIRSFASQFEDDANQFLLPGYATVQLVLRHQLTTRLSAVAAFENILDREYLSGFSPTPTTGAPRLWRAGLRWQGGL